MSRKYKYNYMDVFIPGDVFPESSPEQAIQWMADLAIEVAKERMKTYAIPSKYTTRLIEGKPHESNECVFRVCRKSIR